VKRKNWLSKALRTSPKAWTRWRQRQTWPTGASDVTRGVDAMVVADRVTKLSDIVEAAGVTDVAEGLEIVEDLQAALEQFSEIAEDLEAGNGSGDQIPQ
jgi:hypothetical protein